MKTIIPEAALEQHTAILGKTGSGKTSTAKLAIEQVVAGGARVCVLDPIKSDWWGLTSSADGKRPGLPFHILGGPRGHVPLHSSAGKAIGEIVASGDLPLSIIDMADFAPGGQAHFFVDFAPTLIRRMRGVVYLVIEEAHLFAPKERAGVGAENLSIHWAKTLATAGRSKGIRLLLLTQRVQALHNALLGSCETLIAHRLSAPADQDPVLKWLKANASSGILEMVSAQLSSLKTGAAWVCSGEAKIFERMEFPRIKTFDNTATPTGNGDVQEVKQAPVDAAKLRAIVGEAVAEAEANDPKLLRVRISDLERELKKGHAPAVDQVAIAAARQEGREEGARDGYAAGLRAVQPIADRLGTLGAAVTETIESFQQDLRRLAASAPKAAPQVGSAHPWSGSRASPAVAASSGGNSQVDKPMPRAMLTALAQHPEGLTKGQILVHTGYRSSGPVSGCFADLARNGWTEMAQGRLRITAAGLAALGAYDPLPTGAALREHLLNGSKCSTMEKAMLRVLFGAYPEVIAKGKILEVTGYASSGPVSGAFARLVALGYAKPAGRGALVAAAELFNG